jgi:hypothetical protein
LYLPESWAKDQERRKTAGVPSGIAFQTKPAMALAQIRQAVEQEIPTAPARADSAYGNDSQFRECLKARHLLSRNRAGRERDARPKGCIGMRSIVRQRCKSWPLPCPNRRGRP